MKSKKALLLLIVVFLVTMFVVATVTGADKVNTTQQKQLTDMGGGGMSIWMRYLQSLGWAVVASIGFAFGVGIGIKVFDLLSTKIDEWEEIKNGNWSVALIIVSLIVMIGLIVIKIM